MRLSYVIDNQAYKLANVLNAVMASRAGHSLDIATAYFSVSGFRLLQEQLEKLRSFRLLLGFQPTEGKDVGLRPVKSALGWTDGVIDQVVYRVYGLTDEEVKVVEGKG